jgi:hypothetical protein
MAKGGAYLLMCEKPTVGVLFIACMTVEKWILLCYYPLFHRVYGDFDEDSSPPLDISVNR